MRRTVLLVMVPLIFACSPADHSADHVGQEVSAWRSEARTRNDQLLESTNRLEASVKRFLDDTDESRLDAVRAAWKQAHEDYLAAAVYFVGQTNDLVFRIDAWPIMAGFLDSVPGYPQSGIVNDYAISIDAATLIDQHGLTSPEEVSLGFHALEYLIFSRPLTDFIPVHTTGPDTTSRRRETCRIIAELLVMDVNQFVQLSTDRLTSLGEGPDASRELIATVRDTINNLNSEADQLIDEDNGHSRFSGTSWSNLRVQVRSLSRITGEPVRMSRYLAGIDEEQAMHLTATIAGLIAILNDDASERRERIPLLLAALSHQMEDLVRTHARQDQDLLPP